MPNAYRTIGQVAALTGLTVRALHHYDAIVLVCPSHRSGAGYRLYTDDDLRRLQQVLLLRELGFGLDAVRDLIDAPADRKREALLAQRVVLDQQRRHADAVLRAVDATLHSLETHMTMNTKISTEHLFEGYEQFQNGEYAKEAEQRWGETDSWKISKQRTGGYSKEDWARIATEANAITADFLATMQRGDPAASQDATAIAERHRAHIERYFYPCSHLMHTQVASLYTNDPRFQAQYDQHAAGLAAYIEAAVHANAEKHQADVA